jgi:hypothetical protein
VSHGRNKSARLQLYKGYKPDTRYSQTTTSGAYAEVKLDKKDTPGAYVVKSPKCKTLLSYGLDSITGGILLLYRPPDGEETMSEQLSGDMADEQNRG